MNMASTKVLRLIGLCRSFGNSYSFTKKRSYDASHTAINAETKSNVLAAIDAIFANAIASVQYQFA